MVADNTSSGFEALARGGVFHQQVAGFTPRRAQQEMAKAVADTLVHGGALVVESGTGTGKTYAYLVPLIQSSRRAIISTGTKHLQEQIFHRDLPQVAKALGLPVHAVLLKGRANYLCRYRLKQHLQQSDLVGRGETESLRAIERWATGTDSGDIAEMTDIGEDSLVWRRATSTADNCLGGTCPDFKGCFVVKARQRAMKADVVVVNHHLFFSDLTLKAEGFGELLPKYDAVVFDEAHTIAEIASMFFGFSISSGQVTDLARDAAAAAKAEKRAVDLKKQVAGVERAVRQVQRACKRFDGQSADLQALQRAGFEEVCRPLQEALEVLAQVLSKAAAGGEELRRCHERCLLLQEQLDSWLGGGDPNLIRWAEAGGRWFRLQATPLSISAHFEDMMGKGGRAAWVFTSATLAVGDDFSAFCERLGLRAADTRRWDSPYNFRGNALMYLPPDMPDPREQEDYADALSAVIVGALEASRGRAFCLFTSHAMMGRVHRRLEKATPWPVLMQGEVPKSELLKRFKAQANSVLLGTASFWEGVDVKGDSLSCVIIDKLPFASPGDPVLKSRLTACEEGGGAPFPDIQLPAAVIALKQGVGRLIRSETDRGVLVLCDPRLLGRGYGRLFLDSLPGMPRTRELSDMQAFFADGGGSGVR